MFALRELGSGADSLIPGPDVRLRLSSSKDIVHRKQNDDVTINCEGTLSLGIRVYLWRAEQR